ncbi:MAG: hypothetical protein ACO25F_09590 [Erythrobacter sp.]
MSDEAQSELSAAARAAMIEQSLAAIERAMSEQDDRLSLIEQRLEDQEYSVRRVLDLLIEWLEEGAPNDKDRQEAA